MRLVTDQQIKMTAGEELPLLILCRIDAIHHRLIRREHTVRMKLILLLT